MNILFYIDCTELEKPINIPLPSVTKSLLNFFRINMDLLLIIV